MDTGSLKRRKERRRGTLADARRHLLTAHWPSISAVAMVAVAVSYGVYCSGMASALRFRAPEQALRYFPDARAAGALAEKQLLASPKPGARPGIRALAQQSLLRDPVVARSVRVLAMIEALDGRTAKADRLIAYSSWLTRRDLGTSLYQIERAVERNDVAGALRTFDIVLRTDRTGYNLLFPILANAFSDPELFVPIQKLLREDPPWLRAFVDFATQAPPSIVPLSHVLRTMHKSPALDLSAHSAIAARLVKDGQYIEAARYARAVRGAGTGGLVQAPKFADAMPIQPFAWTYREDADMSAGQNRAANGTVRGITFSVSGAKEGWLVSQMLALPVGRYRLASVGATTGTSRPRAAYWEVLCLPNEREIARLAVPHGEPDQRVETLIQIPAECSGQVLRLQTAADDGAAEGEMRQIDLLRP